MNKYLLIAIAALVAVVAVACAAPAAQPAQPQPTAPPQIVKETVVVEGTPQVVEKVVTATPAPTEAPARPNVIRFNFGVGDVPTLDPNVAEDTSSITVIDNSFIGLTRLDEVTNELYPGMAESWEVSPDGKTYTFKIRQGIPWVKYDGTKVVKVQTCPDESGATKDRVVTAKDFEYGILRALKPETASPYAYVLGFVIEGANDYNSGTITDTALVGVKAIDDNTLQVKFIEDAAYNPMIMGLWTGYATPQWLIEGDDCTEARGERWIEPGFFQSYGPYTLKDWVHDTELQIIRNPFWPGIKGIPQAKVEEVHFTMLDEAPAMAEFEAGNLDAVAVPTGDLDRVKADPNLSKLLVTAPVLCTYYAGFNTKAPYVNNVHIRRALSYAIDRQGLIDNVLKGGQEPAPFFARPGIVAAPNPKDYPDLGIKFDPVKAKEELELGLQELGITADQLDITYMFNTSSGHQLIAEYLQQQWKENLGIDVKLTNQEWRVFLETIKSKDTPQIWRLGWCLDYPDANNFTREVFAVNGSSNPAENGEPYGGINWKNEKFEELVRQAAVEKDIKKRTDLYAQAEQILCVEDAAIIPIYFYTRNSVTQPWVKRTFSVGGHEFFYNWEVLQ